MPPLSVLWSAQTQSAEHDSQDIQAHIKDEEACARSAGAGGPGSQNKLAHALPARQQRHVLRPPVRHHQQGVARSRLLQLVQVGLHWGCRRAHLRCPAVPAHTPAHTTLIEGLPQPGTVLLLAGATAAACAGHQGVVISNMLSLIT